MEVYAVAFKKRRSSRLLWVLTTTPNVSEASKQAASFVGDAYREYGHSRVKIWRVTPVNWMEHDRKIADGFVPLYVNQIEAWDRATANGKAFGYLRS